MVLPQSSSDAWSLGTGEVCRQGKRQIQDETLTWWDSWDQEIVCYLLSKTPGTQQVLKKTYLFKGWCF